MSSLSLVEGMDVNIENGINVQSDLDEGIDVNEVVDEEENDDDILTKKKKGLHPHDIDASWLQRRISKYYVNPIVVQNKAAKVLDILKNATGDRDVEKKLVTLLDYERYDLIIVLKKYRNMILYCTLLANAQS